MDIISRKKALELGLKRYFTGQPCPHGHIEERHVASYSCITCQTNLHNKWQRENHDECKRRKRLWRAANRSKARARDKIYDAVRYGKLIMKPERGTGVLMPNLRLDQCKAILK